MADDSINTNEPPAHRKVLHVPPSWIRLAHLALWLENVFDLTDAYIVRQIVLELRDRKYMSLGFELNGKLVAVKPEGWNILPIDWSTFDVTDPASGLGLPLYARWTAVADIVAELPEARHYWERTKVRIAAEGQSQVINITSSHIERMGDINVSGTSVLAGSPEAAEPKQPKAPEQDRPVASASEKSPKQSEPGGASATTPAEEQPESLSETYDNTSLIPNVAATKQATELPPAADLQTRAIQFAADHPGEGQLFKKYQAERRKPGSMLPRIQRKLFPTLPGKGRTPS